MSKNWNDDPYEDRGYYAPEYGAQDYADPGYYEPPYDDSGYADPDARPPRNPVTIALAVALVICSIGSCIVGIVGGIGIWEYTAPPGEAKFTDGAGGGAAPVAGGNFYTWGAVDIVDAFQYAGLECQDPQPIPAEGSSAPFYFAEATRFLIPSLCETCGGRIYSFDNPADLAQAQAYYVSLGDTDPSFSSWVFVKDNILVQINGELPPDWANQYEAVLTELR